MPPLLPDRNPSLSYIFSRNLQNRLPHAPNTRPLPSKPRQSHTLHPPPAPSKPRVPLLRPPNLRATGLPWKTSRKKRFPIRIRISGKPPLQPTRLAPERMPRRHAGTSGLHPGTPPRHSLPAGNASSPRMGFLVRLLQFFDGIMRIHLGRSQGTMPQQGFHRIQVRPSVKQMRGKRMPQHMRAAFGKIRV